MRLFEYIALEDSCYWLGFLFEKEGKHKHKRLILNSWRLNLPIVDVKINVF